MKKILSLILTLTLSLTLFTSVAYADNLEGNNKNYDKIVKMVNKTNKSIENKIEEAVAKADKLTAQYEERLEELKKSKNYEKKAEVLTNVYDMKIEKISQKLIRETDRIAHKTFEKAEEKGFKVKCNLIPVKLGNKIVMVDPIIVVNC